MADIKRQSRYDFLLESFDSEEERKSLRAEYEFFMAINPDKVAMIHLPDDVTHDQFVNHVKYSVAHLNAEGYWKSVTHELAHGFSWKIALGGEDYWELVWKRYENKRRVAEVANIAGVKERSKKEDPRAAGDRLAVEALELQMRVDQDKAEFDRANAERAKREAVHESNKIHLLHARKELLEKETECDPPVSDS